MQYFLDKTAAQKLMEKVNTLMTKKKKEQLNVKKCDTTVKRKSVNIFYKNFIICCKMQLF